MTDALNALADVEIDPDGTFKYILVHVKVKDGTENKVVVRGAKSAQYHIHILEQLTAALEQLGLEGSCPGGGKIQHSSAEKKLHVFGESTGYGRADHALTAQKLRSVYTDYQVTVE